MTSQKKNDIVRWIPPILTIIAIIFGGGALFQSVQANTKAIQANANAIQANAQAIQNLQVQRAVSDGDLINLKEKVEEIRSDVKLLLRRGVP